jgi:hypothetical protein
MKKIPRRATDMLRGAGFSGILYGNPLHRRAYERAPSPGTLAWRKCPVILCVAAAIAADMLLYLAL